MQHVSPPVQMRYPPPYHNYPIGPTVPSSTSSLLLPQYAPLASPQSIKSVDASTVHGPPVPPSSKTIHNQVQPQYSSPQNDADLRRLILFNLPIDIIREYLELYLEHLSGEAEIERIDYSNLDESTVMVTFKSELDMAEVRRRHTTRSKLNESEIAFAEVQPPATVMIRNLPSDISRDVLELYFSNRRRSDGGHVVDVTLDNDQQHALVTFADYRDVRRVIKREHLIHGHRLDVRIFFNHMGIEPFIDAAGAGKLPDPIRYRASDDSRYAFLVKNRPLLDQLREHLKPLFSRVSFQTDNIIEILFVGTRSTSKRRTQWTKDVGILVENFLNEHLVVQKLPWNNAKLPAITPEQLADLSLKDNTRLLQLSPSDTQPDHIIITALKTEADRAVSELQQLISGSVALVDAVYRSKPLSTSRDPKVSHHRSSLLLRSSPPQQSTSVVDVPPPPIPPNTIINDSIDNLRLFQLDLLSMRFVDLARRSYVNLHIDIDRVGRRVHFRGPPDQVAICKSYFESILTSVVYKHYSIGKEMAVFLSNPDTVELVIGNLMRSEHVCAYEIERINGGNHNHHRRSSVSPTPASNNTGGTSLFSSAVHSSTSNTNSHHKLVLYGLTRDGCDRVYDLLRQDIRVCSIMLDKDDKRCLASDSWQTYVRDLYSMPGGFRRRRVLLQVKQNQLTLVGFEQDVNAMRKTIYDYFVENAISFYESD